MTRPLSLSALAMAIASCSVSTPSVATVPVHAPRGGVIFRPECFGSVEQERMPTVSRKQAPSAPPPVAMPEAMEAAPMADDLGGARAESRKDTMSVGSGRTYSPPAPPPPPPPPAKLRPAPADEEAPSSWPPPPSAPSGRAQEWGATVYLSNDDSMSLASAQRALYALKSGAPLSVSQIRPHELLNYFSFDHATPDPEQGFDVFASAVRDGNQLSVALAVKGATPPRQDLDLTLLVDRSCSMEAEGRMDYTQRGLTLLADQLRRGDRVDVVLFDDSACVPLENYVVGRDDPGLLRRTIAAMAPRGSTDVGLGLREAYRVAKSHYDTGGRNRRVMILTDALLNTGDVDPNTVTEIGRAYDADGIRLTGIGVGSEFNDQVLDKLTEKGKGAYVFLGSEAVVDRVFGPAGFEQLVQTIAHDVHFALKLPPSLAVERFYGEEASTRREEVQPINYYAGTTQLFLQDLAIRDGRAVPSDPVVLEIDYTDALTGRQEVRTFRTTVGAMLASDPHNVDKGKALMAFTDWLTARAMGGAPCGDEVRTYASRAARVEDDAEIAFVNGLVRNTCGDVPVAQVVTARGGVPFKVRVDSDIAITQVALSCGMERSTDTLSGSDTIAMFTARPGTCDLTLSGTVDMVARVEVPSVGGDLRCVVRGGRVSCG